LLIGFVSRRSVIKHDTAIGILFVAMFALGIALVQTRDNYTANLFEFVFGNVLAVTWNDVWLVAAIGAGVLAFVLLFYKELLFSSYDPTMAAATGLPVGWIQYALMAMLALTTVIALKTVGIVLVVALLITPAATAFPDANPDDASGGGAGAAATVIGCMWRGTRTFQRVRP
jgi:iron/zinc/copper transport system permease protein